MRLSLIVVFLLIWSRANAVEFRPARIDCETIRAAVGLYGKEQLLYLAKELKITARQIASAKRCLKHF